MLFLSVWLCRMQASPFSLIGLIRLGRVPFRPTGTSRCPTLRRVGGAAIGRFSTSPAIALHRRRSIIPAQPTFSCARMTPSWMGHLTGQVANTFEVTWIRCLVMRMLHSREIRWRPRTFFLSVLCLRKNWPSIHTIMSARKKTHEVSDEVAQALQQLSSLGTESASGSEESKKKKIGSVAASAASASSSSARASKSAPTAAAAVKRSSTIEEAISAVSKYTGFAKSASTVDEQDEKVRAWFAAGKPFLKASMITPIADEGEDLEPVGISAKKSKRHDELIAALTIHLPAKIAPCVTKSFLYAVATIPKYRPIYELMCALLSVANRERAKAPIVSVSADDSDDVRALKAELTTVAASERILAREYQRLMEAFKVQNATIINALTVARNRKSSITAALAGDHSKEQLDKKLFGAVKRKEAAAAAAASSRSSVSSEESQSEDDGDD